MDSKNLHNMVDKIMRLSMENLLASGGMPKDIQEQILVLVIQEATELIQIFFTDEEIQAYAKASELILSIPKEKMHALQSALGPKITPRIEEIIASA